MLSALITRSAVVLGLLVMVATAWSAPMKWTLGGYLQGRFAEDFGTISVPTPTDNASTFLALRPSVLIRAFDEEHIFLQMFVQTAKGTSDPEFVHAFAEYRAKPYYARLGLGPIPFGYENPVSSCLLITTERSQVSNELVGPLANDRGIFVYYTPAQAGKFNASLGVVNGTAYNVSRDPNNAKNVVARLGYTIPGGEIGVSAIQGSGTQAIDPGTFDRLGVDVVWVTGSITVISELMSGKTGTLVDVDPSPGIEDLQMVDTDANGGYLTVACRKQGSNWMPYARVDILDRNTDAAGDHFSRVTGGVSYYLTPLSKLQAEYENIDDNLNPNLDGRFTAQYQIIF